MSLPNYLDRLREKIAVWMKRHYRLRQRQLKVVRLEDRRLPDASFALVGDILTVEAFDGATEAVDVSFDANSNEFQLELSSGTWLSENPGPLDPAVSLNGNVLTVALPSLSELQIHGSGTPIHITDSGNAFSIGQLTITGAADVVLDSANDIDSGTMKYRAIGTTAWTEVSLKGLMKDNNFVIPAFETSVQIAPLGIEATYEYRDLHNNVYSSGGTLKWQATP